MACIVTLTLWSPPALVPQHAAEPDARLVAVIEALQLELAGRPLVLERRVSCDRLQPCWSRGERWGEPRDSAEAAWLAARLSATVGSESESRRCGDGPSSCRLLGGITIVALSEPRDEDGLVLVRALLWAPTESARAPVVAQTIRFELSRTTAGWRVVRRVVERIT